MSGDDPTTRRDFLAGVAITVGAAGLAGLPAQAAAAATPVRRRAANRRVLASDRQGFNRRWYAPNLRTVYVPTEIDEVVAHVEAALSTYGRNVKVTSGRHCYENFVYNDDTRAVIDMSALGRAGYDREEKAFYIEAGCENWTAYRSLLNGHGKTIPAGSCYSVGAGGHISGGGYGLLSRLHGLTVDHLSAVDIVTWNAATERATLRRVSPRSTDRAERDLFWALCGAGGGNFGVIVRYWFDDLPDAPAQATIWNLAWNWSDLTPPAFAALLAEFTEMSATLPPEQFSALKLTHASAGQVGMLLQVASGPGASRDTHVRAAEEQVERIRRRFAKVARARPVVRPFGGQPAFQRVPPASQNADHLTYLEALQTLNGSGPNQFGKYKSAYMRKGFPAEQVEAIHTWLNRTPDGAAAGDFAQSLLQVDSYGGAVNTRSSSATPVPQRSSILKLQYQTYWNNDSPIGQGDVGVARAQAERHVEWIRGFYRDVYAPYGGVPDPERDETGTVDGCYYNYPDVDLGSRTDGGLEEALRLYFGDNLRRNRRNLVAVKRRWDPREYFTSAQSIPAR